MTGHSDRSWDLATLADNGLRDIVDACTGHGPQPITRGGETVAVMISMKDWMTIRDLLKHRIAEGVLGADDSGDHSSAEVVQLHRPPKEDDEG